MHTSRLVVGVLAGVVALTGCPRNTGNNNATSSSGGAASSSAASSSSGGASSSGGSASSTVASSSGGRSSSAPQSSSAAPSSSVATSGGLPLDQLCLRLADGYARGATYVLTSLNSTDCAPGFATDLDLVRFQAGELGRIRTSLCDPDGGALFAVARAVAQGSAQGRITYDALEAEACTQAGRGAIATAGGLAAFAQASLADGGAGNALNPTFAAAVAACRNAIVGRQASGAACANDAECAQGDAGAQCMARGGASCEGTCRPMGLVGATCGTGYPDCAGSLQCNRGVCTAPGAAGASCLTPDGGTLPCGSGLFCRNGICDEGGREDAGCTAFFSPDCAPGYFCNEDQRCEPRRPQGSGCVEENPFNPPCQSCLTCFVPGAPDGGWEDAGGVMPGACTTFAGLNESCDTRPCHVAFTCINGSCQARARTGANCVLDPNDTTGRGNCLSRTDVCQGNPTVCMVRPLLGEVCTAAADSFATTGNCDDSFSTNIWCLRARQQDTTGFCRGPAAVGEACGRVQNLPPECIAGASCSATQDGGMGVCLAQENVAAGGGCTRDTQCVRGHYCAPGDAGVGTCTPGGALNADCSASAAWGDVCLQGVCRNVAGMLRCQPALGEGATCTTTEECGSTLRCEATDAGRLCTPRLPLGARCTASSECADTLVCNGGLCVGQACVASEETASCVNPGTLTMALFFGSMVVLRRRRK